MYVWPHFENLKERGNDISIISNLVVRNQRLLKGLLHINDISLLSMHAESRALPRS